MGCYDQIPCFVLISTPHSLSFLKEERRKRKGKEKKEKRKDLFNSYTSSWKILEPGQSRQYLMKSNCLQNSQPALVKNCYSEVALTTTALAGLLRVCFSTSPGKFAQGFKVFCCCCVCALCQPCSYDTFRKLHGDLYSPISVPAAARGELQPPSPQRLPLSPPTLALAVGENTGMCPLVSGMRAVAKWLPISWSNAKLLGLPDPPGQFLTLGPRHAAPGRMWFLGFAPSTPFLPIFPHLHSAGALNRKGPAPINTSHTCRWVTAAWFRAQTSQNFSLCYCTFLQLAWGVLRGALSQEDKNWAFSAAALCSLCPSPCGTLHKPAFLEEKPPEE